MGLSQVYCIGNEILGYTLNTIMTDEIAGFAENEHTADWELEAWASDLPGLLEQAARGMYQLSGITLAKGPRQTRQFELDALDAENMLVRFLSELLYFSEQECLAFDTFDLRFESEELLHARLDGAPIAELNKHIKAVTYHNMAIRRTDEGLEVNIVFDV